jgi:hypothetical protein
MLKSTLRPGLLVSLKTSVRGNVSYQTRDLETEHVTASGQKRARWETERVIMDPQEHVLATQVRSKVRTIITAVCSTSTFGLLCPEAAEEELDKAIAEAQQLASDFNARATLTRIGVYVIAGRIAPDDVEAVRAINSEVRELLADMEAGVRNLDAKAIRDAANKARGIGAMLQPEAAARIQMAISAARTAAREIVKAGETGAAEIDKRAIRAITESRTAFLDLDGDGDVATPETVGRAIDLVPEPERTREPAMAAPRLDL